MEDEEDFTLNLSSVISTVFDSAKKSRAERGNERSTLGVNKCCIEEEESEIGGEGEKLIMFDKENLFTPLKSKRKSTGRKESVATPPSRVLTPLGPNAPQSARSTPEVLYSTTKRRGGGLLESPEEGEPSPDAPEERQGADLRTPEGADESARGEEEEAAPLCSARKPKDCSLVLESPESPGLADGAVEDEPQEEEPRSSSFEQLREAYESNEGLATIRKGLLMMRDGGLNPVDLLLDVIQVGAQYAPLPEDLLASEQLTEDVIVSILSTSIENLESVLLKAGAANMDVAEDGEVEATTTAEARISEPASGEEVEEEPPTPLVSAEHQERGTELLEAEVPSCEEEGEDLMDDAGEDTAKTDDIEAPTEGQAENSNPPLGIDASPIQVEEVEEVLESQACDETSEEDDGKCGLGDDLPAGVQNRNFLRNVTVRSRRNSTFIPLEDSDSSDMDLSDDDGDDQVRHSAGNSFDLPSYAKDAASEMAEKGIHDVVLSDGEGGEESAFVDSHARDWNSNGAKPKGHVEIPPTVNAISEPGSCRTSAGSDEFQSAESNFSSSSLCAQENETPDVSSARCECSCDGKPVDGVSQSEADSDMEVCSPLSATKAGVVTEVGVLDDEDIYEEFTPERDQRAASEDDMSCSSGEPCLTMSTRKPKRSQLLIESDSEDSIFASENDEEEVSPGRDMVFEGSDLGASSASDRSHLAMKKFQREKEGMVKKLFSEFNSRIFDRQLPDDLEVTWNPSLATTAGITKYSRKMGLGGEAEYTASVELSTKVIDCESRLKQTFCHELCHVAAWLINHIAKPPHGKVFKSWAARAMEVYPDLNVSTCHTYDIHYKFRWQCKNDWCGRIYGRHSNSINVDKQACGICSGRLGFLGKFNADGTPAKSRGPSKFSLFVKENYNNAKKELGQECDHAAIMKHLSAKWAGTKTKSPASGSSDPARSNNGVKSLIAKFQGL